MADCASGSEVEGVHFVYTATASDEEPDGVTVAANALVAGSAAIVDEVGNDADLSHGALDDQPALEWARSNRRLPRS